jgi:tetratricopeptide (TPR) repeat protein
MSDFSIPILEPLSGKNLAEQEAFLKRAYAFEEQADYATASIYYYHFLQYFQDNAWVYAHLADCLAKSGDLAAAMENFNQSLELDPDYTWARIGRGSLYQEQGYFNHALNDFQAALRESPNDVWLLNQIGDCLTMLNRFEEAASYFQQSVGLEPDHPWNLAHLGMALVRFGQIPEGVEYLRQAINLNANYSWAAFNLGLGLWHSGNREGAIKAFDHALACQPVVPDVYYERAALLLEMGEAQQALLDISAWLADHPADSAGLCLLGDIRTALGEREAALEAFQKALDAGESHYPVHTEMGILLMESQRPQAAREQFDQALSINPKDTSALANRGEVLRRMGDYKSALADLSQAIEWSTEPSAWMFAVRGKIYAQLADHATALENFNLAIELDPQYDWAFQGRVQTLEALGKLAEARRECDQMLARNAENVWALNQRAALALKKKAFAEAELDLAQVLSIEPKNESAISRLLDLNRERKTPDQIFTLLEQLPIEEPYSKKRLLAEACRLMERYAEAIQIYGELLDDRPEQDDLLKLRALAYKNSLQIPQAWIDLQVYLQNHPQDATALAYRGQVLRNLRKFKQAIESYHQALQYAPQTGWIIGNRGLAFLHLGDLSSARQDFDQAFELDYANPWLYNRQSEVCLLAGEVKKAAKWLRRSLKADPDSGETVFLESLTQTLSGNSADSHDLALRAVALTQAEQDQPGWNLRGLLALAERQLFARQTTTALSTYRAAIAKNPAPWLLEETIEDLRSFLMVLQPDVPGAASAIHLLQTALPTAQRNHPFKVDP